ncbi:MAG: GNAT family N-acetyltransferase [Solirubrobacterales bacterium]|nr:GNAT family N-acetyltransferase [Solirubrobacterales bacterium]
MTRGELDLVLTERLRCERLRREHSAELAPMLLDPRVVRTLWPRDEPPTEQDVNSSTASHVGHWERYGFGLWLLRDRDTGGVVGRGGLQYTYVPGLNEVEAAWAIAPERWGQGLATELAQAAIVAAFNTLKLLQIVAVTLPDNIASRRVMEKTGFVYEREIEHAGLPHVLYVRTAGK